MKPLALTALLLISAAACQPTDRDGAGPGLPETQASNSAQHAQGGNAPVSGPSIRFAKSLSAAQTGEFDSAFALLGQRNIVAKFELPQEALPEGSALLRFEILNPAGVTHSSKWYAIRYAGDTPATLYNPILEQEVPTRSAEIRNGFVTFYGKIPVAGTNFTRYRLHGSFTAKVFIGSDDAQPLAAQSFEVNL